MSFDTYKNLPVSKKIVLLEIDLPIKESQANDILINYEAGLWYNKLTPGAVYVNGSDGQVGYYENQNEDDYKDVTSVKVDGIDYVKVNTLAELRVQQESFYYDKDTTELYFHFADWRQPLDSNIIIGIALGFCDTLDSTNGAYFGGKYYEPRILSVPAITKSKDPLFFGILRFQGGAVKLLNNDGYFDNFRSLNAYRQTARIKLGFDGLDYEDYRTVFTGYVQKYTQDFTTFSITLQDLRKGLSREIPNTLLTLDDYPYLSENNVNAVKPLAYGVIRGAPCICLNEEESAASYDFLLMDTTYYSMSSVSAVYVDGSEISSAYYTVNLAAGTISINAAQCSDNLGDITCDFTGINIQNGVSVIESLLLKYNGKAFISTNYNIREWGLAKSVCRNVAVYEDESRELSKIIEEICDSCDLGFIVQDDGKYTARIYNENRTAATTIYTDEYVDDPVLTLDEDKFLSSVQIKYNKNQNSDTFLKHVNTDYEDEVFDRYKSYQQKTFETILPTLSDAMEKSESVMALSKNITDVIKRTVKTQHVNLEIMDFVIAAPNTREGATEKWGYHEIVGIQKNLSKAEVELSMRFVKVYTPPESLDYEQGYVWFNRLYGDKLFSTTRYY